MQSICLYIQYAKVSSYVVRYEKNFLQVVTELIFKDTIIHDFML